MSATKNIIREMLNHGYATSPRLVDIAGFRYGARIYELRQKGFEFTWGFRRKMVKDDNGNLKSKKTHTTIYTLLTPKSKIDHKTLEIIQ